MIPSAKKAWGKDNRVKYEATTEAVTDAAYQKVLEKFEQTRVIPDLRSISDIVNNIVRGGGNPDCQNLDMYAAHAMMRDVVNTVGKKIAATAAAGSESSAAPKSTPAP